MKKKRVLIVDDEKDFLKTATLRIDFEGFEVMDACDGRRALKLIDENGPPDIILLDIMMPEIDGVEVFKRLRNNPATAKVPVIFVTAWPRLAADPIIKADPRCAFINKPFKFEDLFKMVNEMLAKHSPR